MIVIRKEPNVTSGKHVSISVTKAAKILGLNGGEVVELILRGHLRNARVVGRNYMAWEDQVKELAKLGVAEIRRSKLT